KGTELSQPVQRRRRTAAPVVNTTSTERASVSTVDGAMGSRRVCIGNDAGAVTILSGMALLLLIGFGARRLGRRRIIPLRDTGLGDATWIAVENEPQRI